MPIFGNNNQQASSGGRKNGSSNSSNANNKQGPARQSPSMILRRKLGGNQRIAPQTSGDDIHDLQHQRHVARSTFGQQHHSSRPSAWVIPFEQEEIIPSYNPKPAIAALPSADGSSFDSEEEDGLPIITPDRTTPCMSNRKNKNPNKISIKRDIHNSHRKQRLHHITPRLVVSTQQQAASSSTQPQPGNGVVLDLTSLFTGDSKGPQSPSETATTAASTNPQRRQQASPFVHGPKSPISFAYNAPVPPWRNRNRAAASPVTVASEQKNTKDMDTFDNSSIVNALQNNREDLQWDSKSQTTQEALLTQRQGQALTQWLNFVLVGEQEQQLMQEEALASNKKGRRKASFDNDELRSRATTPTGAGRSLANTPIGGRSVKSHSTTPTHGGRSVATTPTGRRAQSRMNTPTYGHSNTPTPRPCTPSGRSVASITTTGRATPGFSGRSIASVTTAGTGRATPGALASPSNATQPANRRRHRRLSLFQYGDSYEHAQDQGHHWFQHSPQWKELRRRIRMEIASGKLTLREDRNLYANVGCRDTLLELFCSYKPAWLTLALEVVMNDPIIPPQGHSLPTNKQLKNFIVHKVLIDAKLLSKYTQGRGSGTPSGKFEKAFQAELRPLVLYRILVLVFFLDRAAVKFQAQNNQLGNLFLAKGKVKSTSQVLVMICREFLSKQGDIVKQLARVNLHVYYKQHRLDEIEYPIVNFAVDLRDGVRLCRVVEVLWLLPRRHGYLLNNQNSGGGIDLKVKYPLLHQLRIPAISRLQKIHNVNVALGALQEQCQVGLPSDLQAHHIVDGQRRMVMALVWTIVLMHCFEGSELLTPEQVEEEIAMAQDQRDHNKEMQERKWHHQKDQNGSSMDVLERESDGVESLALVSHDASKTTVQVAGGRPPASNLPPMLSESRSSSFDEDDASRSTLGEIPVIQKWKGLLFQWCQEVCMLVDEEETANSSLSGANSPPKKTTPDQWTTTDLANGKALCCLIHHYHPAILPMEELRLASRVVNGPPTRIETSSAFTLSALRLQQRSPNITPDYYMRLAQRRLNEIGGIPPMMLLPLDKAAKGYNQRKKPSVVALGEEKSILVFLYHVCARLIESRHQVQAVVFVQQRYRYLRNVTLWRRKLQAAKSILLAWRASKSNYYRARERKYREAVAVIEDFVSLNFCKLLILQEKRLSRDLKNLAITPIQALVRRFLSNKNLQDYFLRKEAVIKIQARFRQFHAYHSYQILLLEIKAASTVVQRHWRGYVQRRTYASIIDATITLQSILRGAGVKQRLQLWNASATCIQKIWKGFWDQLHYQMDLLDILAVQCLVRKQQAIESARTKSHAVGVLQRSVRCFLARESLRSRLRESHASKLIQKSVRRMLAIREAAERRAALALLRATLVIQRSWRRTVFLREREYGATKIQTCFRSWTAVAVYAAIRASAIAIQTQWRQYSQRNWYLATINSIKIQAQWRRFAQMKKDREMRSAIRVQAEWRCFAQIKKYRALKSSIKIQAQWRRFAQQQKYLDLVSTIKIQAQWRRVAQQKKYHVLRSTIKIQAQWRCSACQKKYCALIGAIKVQTHWRCYAQQKKYRALTSAIKIQSCWRQQTQQKKYRALVSAIRIQTHWRQYAQGKKYRALVKSIISIQSCLRRWKYGVVDAKRRMSALQMVQNCSRMWLASRLLKSMKNHRDRTIRSATRCQSLVRRNISLRAWNASKAAAIRIQTNWRRYWCSKIFNRRQDLVSALSKCDLFFRHFQKGSFKIVPHTRQVVELSKQTIVRCGKKRIALSNASTWAVPWRGHRQKLFRHRSHVEAVRMKYCSGVSLSNLPRRRITLRVLRNANGAAKGFQAPWVHTQLTRCTRETGRQLSKEKFARIHTKRRTICSRKILSTSIESKAKRTFDAKDVTLAKTFRREMRYIQTTDSRVHKLLHAPTRRLRQYLDTSRVLNLLKRHTNLSLSNKASTSAVQLFEDPFKKKIKMRSAAKIVQRYWRCFAAKKHLRQDLRRVVIVQSIIRQYLAKRLCTAAKAITAMIQAAVRGFLVRQILKKHHANATTVQKYWRGASAQSKYHTMSREYRKAAVENTAATKIQASVRAHMVRRELLLLRACAVIVQKSARGWLAREQVKPVIRNLRDSKMAAKIQNLWRGHNQRLKFQRATKSVVIAQSVVRRWRAQRKFRQLLQEEWEMVAKESAVKIQAAWRSFSRRIDFMFTILCLVKIQSWWRPIAQQKLYQRANERRLVEHKDDAATRIQCIARVLLARSRVMKLRASQQAAVAAIQRCVRGFVARQQLSLENFAATEIQRVWRGYDDESGYIYVVVSVIKIQSFCRMANAKKNHQALLLESLQDKLHEYAPGTSVKSKKKFCRRMSAQKLAADTLKMKMQRQRDSAVQIQSIWRMALVRIHRKQARAILEREVQWKEQEKEQAALIEYSAVKIQSFWRMVSAIEETSNLARGILEEEALLKSQSSNSPPKAHGVATEPKPQPLAKLDVPSTPSTPKHHDSVPEEAKASTPLRSQKADKPRKAIKKLPALSPRAKAEFHQRLSLSQGLVRGFLARRQSNAAVREVQVLIKEAELRSRLHPSMRLGARMENALSVLKTSRSLTEIMNVVCTIELATRFSRECCAEFVQAGATEILVALLYDLNKSLPHVELLYYLMRTLLNVCKYSSMVNHVANVETAKAFLHLIRMYGSEDAVFCSAVSLLEVCASRNAEVRALIATPASKRRMEGICRQWERKLDRRLAMESPSSGLSTPQRMSREAPSQNVYTPQFMSKRNKAKTDMLILGISYDLQNGVATFRQVLSRTK